MGRFDRGVWNADITVQLHLIIMYLQGSIALLSEVNHKCF